MSEVRGCIVVTLYEQQIVCVFHSDRCFKRYNRLLDPPHHCELEPPPEQKKYQPILVWDTEAYTDHKGRHICNAVGFSYENRDKPGHFSECYIYDTNMEHPESGIEHEDTFVFNYLPDRVSHENFIKVPKRFRDFQPVVRGEAPNDEEREVEQVLGVGAAAEEQASHDLARQFILDEAAEDGHDDEDEEVELGGDWLVVEQQEAVGDVPRQEFPMNVWQEVEHPGEDDDDDDSEIVSSAMEQFVDTVVTKKFYGCVCCLCKTVSN